MCRMLGKCSTTEFSPSFELLDAPHSLREQSKCGKQPDRPNLCGPHASGCGMSWRSGTGVATEKRGAEDRWNTSFEELIRKISTTGIIAHNRLASPGLRVDVSCSHPFTGNWRNIPVAFCHNGGIDTFMEEARRQGVSDSLLFMGEILRKTDALGHSSLCSLLRDFTNSWKYTSLSALLLTPDSLHGWRCYDERSEKALLFEEYYTLFHRAEDEGVTIASEPLDSSPGWSLLENRTIVSFTVKNGAIFRELSTI